MIHRRIVNRSVRQLFSAFLFSGLFLVSVGAHAEGVFLSKNKAQHQMKGAELNRIKAEHQLRFGQKRSNAAHYNTNNPWEKKKQKTQASAKGASWGDCRDYALHKRNRCYREGRDAYRCEQAYEARTRLCDSTL